MSVQVWNVPSLSEFTFNHIYWELPFGLGRVQKRILLTVEEVSPLAKGMATAVRLECPPPPLSLLALYHAFAGYDGSVYLMEWTVATCIWITFLPPI